MVDIKALGRPPAFGFIQFDRNSDAEDAVAGRDGYEMEGPPRPQQSRSNSKIALGV